MRLSHRIQNYLLEVKLCDSSAAAEMHSRKIADLVSRHKSLNFTGDMRRDKKKKANVRPTPTQEQA